MEKFLFVVLIFLSFSLSFGSFLFFTELNVEFPEEMYETLGTKSFLVKYFTLFENERQKGIIFSGWIFLPTSQSEKFVELRVEGKEETHTFKVKTRRDGFYLVIPPHLLIVPKEAKIFLEEYEIGSDPVD
ncbi:hypothetical protein [Thermotoga sp. KOL6]|uniref:hypothetical protein n=1 Tax=Thermotoga sp. KOL6 TaxID=126741 RepID=UPI000CB814E6|nr:hypothetical protein [Thermotoga sp. KOL6]PLV60383.1 hypothetical protein AS005_03655 [Thermotoga sp. KOL6]